MREDVPGSSPFPAIFCPKFTNSSPLLLDAKSGRESSN